MPIQPSQKENFPVVRVTWLDAADLQQPWAARDDIENFTREPCEVVSWGYLVKATRSYVTLAADRMPGDQDEAWGRIIKIPRRMIRKLERLEAGPASA